MALTPDQAKIKSRLGKSRRENRGGWVYVHIEGRAEDRGFQHGYHLASELREALRCIRALVEMDEQVTFQWIAANAQAMFKPILENHATANGVGQQILREINGIVEGANSPRLPGDEKDAPNDPPVTLTELIGWNAYPEMICQWLPSVKSGHIKPLISSPGKKAPNLVVQRHLRPPSKARPLDAFHSCSAFVANGKMTDGDVVIGHTTWQRFSNGDAYNVVLDINPSEGKGILMQSVPGYVHSSTDFAITGGKLAVAETSLDFSDFDPKGWPEFFRFRRACQYAETIDGWCKLFAEGNNGGYVNTWLLADAGKKKIGAFEISLKGRELLTDPQSGYFASCNIPLTPTLRKENPAAAASEQNILKSGSRKVRFDQLAAEHKGRVDSELAKVILADHLDLYDRTQSPSGRTICGHLDVDKQGRGDSQAPYYPWGSLDGKVASGQMIRDMRIQARWGRACGTPFDADAFFKLNPQYTVLKDYTRDRPYQPWTEFKSS